LIKVKLINRDYKVYSDFIEKSIHNFSNTGVVIKDSRNVIKTYESDKLVLNIKSFKIPNIFNAFIYNKIRSGKAERSYIFAQKLLKLGIDTPKPIAYFEFKTSLFFKNSYYVSEQINYDFSIRDVINDSNFTDRIKILKLFSSFTYKLHENNINYLDHSPGNTLIKVDKGHYKFYLIDLNRMRFETMSLKKRMHNFRRMWLSKKMVRIMATQYAILYNMPFAKVHNLMLSYSKEFQGKANKRKLRRARRKK
jgi:hypothetical protein